MLGYVAAKQVVEIGRSAFFSASAPDLPTGRTAEQVTDDLTPQFGYVGDKYLLTRVLVLGINPGNGPQGKRIAGDVRMMPHLRRFAEQPSEANFAAACLAYKNECRTWPVWKRHCSEILGAGRLSFNEIAYANCLPWCTQSGSKFGDDVATKIERLYLAPLLEDLKPQLIVALGKTRVSEILQETGMALPKIVAWNRSRAPTAAALAERAAAAQIIFNHLSRWRVQRTGADLIAAMQACPDADMEFDFARTGFPVRPTVCRE